MQNQLELAHKNILGPQSFLPRELYFVTFTNSARRKIWVYFLKYKSKVFKKQKASVEDESGRKIKYHIFENNGEYYSEEFEHYYAQNMI